MKSLLGKISNIQSKVVVSKDGTNPHFKSKYITLESIVGVVDPLLRSNGLVVTNHSKNGVLITSIKEIESGDSIESEFPLLTSAKPQEVGSAFTYARRYNLCNLLNIVADRDDDCETASGRDAASTVKQNTPLQDVINASAANFTQQASSLGQVTQGNATPATTEVKKKVSFSKKQFAPKTSTFNPGNQTGANMDQGLNKGTSDDEL